MFSLLSYAKKGKKKIIEGLEQLETVEFNKDDAKLSAKLEIECERKWKKVARIDAMIAAMVINRKTKLYTFNQKHFRSFDKILL